MTESVAGTTTAAARSTSAGRSRSRSNVGARLYVGARAALAAGAFVYCLLPAAVSAHHSYAMFDGSGTRTVSGTVAKLEWRNPHVFIWVYVPSKKSPGKYDLWAFENGSPSVLSALGWNANVLKAGEKITVEYWPLKSGKIGGHWEKATLPDGRVLKGAGGPGRG